MAASDCRIGSIRRPVTSPAIAAGAIALGCHRRGCQLGRVEPALLHGAAGCRCRRRVGGAFGQRRPVMFGPGSGYSTSACRCLTLVWLRALPEVGLLTVLWLFLVVWSTDVMAYVVGRKVGGPKLAPAISPRQDMVWAMRRHGRCSGRRRDHGADDGALFPCCPRSFSPCGLAVVAQIGDLAESALKRRAGVKDSGGLIPGHGGLVRSHRRVALRCAGSGSRHHDGRQAGSAMIQALCLGMDLASDHRARSDRFGRQEHAGSDSCRSCVDFVSRR